MKAIQIITSLLIGLLFIMASCNEELDETMTNPGDGTGNYSEEEISARIYDQFDDDLDMYEDNGFMVIQSDGQPDHGSPYFNTTDVRYEAYNGTNNQFHLNPNRISGQNLTFRIPINPEEASSIESTPMGPMGIARNGVPFYNQYAAGNSPLTNEINSFDQYNGHPQMTGQYHYHIEPLYLTRLFGREALLGVLLDGFPVYGPEEDGQTITNADLDDYHGHFGPTLEFPDGIYHYHITDEVPYLNGDGFFGIAGTISQ